ncbi:MAG TPA: multicopper oxidase domain-containing protein [Ramlibacter sp.]|nr:multicopper oxidase domain-containing protein [Ramlibacter sp.]
MLYLSNKSSAGRLSEAENARRNRLEIVKALADGQVTRRELIKWGIFTAGGMLAFKHGLNPFVSSAYADDSSIPTGFPPSPLFGAKPFTQAMPRFDVVARNPNPFSFLSPAPTAQANTTQQLLNPLLEGVRPGDTGPIEGRPPGPIWAHQRFDVFSPRIAFEVTREPAKVNASYNPQVPSFLNSGIDPRAARSPRFHPAFPDQGPLAMWTYNGTAPPKLLIARYGEPILFRVHNQLPPDRTQNGGFGIHTTSTHLHNGHHGAENDGFTGAYFYPGQFYDYHYPMVLAGINTINTAATDPRAGAPDGSGGITRIPGDWHETMSSLWYHDHMFGFTSQNVYKGSAGMFNYYSALDRGNEGINDGVNLRLPSGTDKDFGNLDYDVNLVIEDKAFDRDGQLVFDIFQTDGFLGDVVTVNFAYKPFFEVERRKYRFRILNGSVARFYKIALSDSSTMIQIANDGNLLPQPVPQTQLDLLGIGERYDIVIDFTRYGLGASVRMVNLAEHEDGRGPKRNLRLADALAGQSRDPGVGAFLEFRIVRDPAAPDVSQVPATLIPNADLSAIPVARNRSFVFGDNGKQTSRNRITAGRGPWGIATDGGDQLDANFGRVSAAPKFGTREIWTLKNDGGEWDHPLHIHFEEGRILARNGRTPPLWEQGRKDVYRLGPDGSVTVSVQFRDFSGMFMEHCHNTTHEDSAMLLRWEIDDSGAPFLQPLPTPIPTPQGVTFIPPDEVLDSTNRNS